MTKEYGDSLISYTDWRRMKYEFENEVNIDDSIKDRMEYAIVEGTYMLHTLAPDQDMINHYRTQVRQAKLALIGIYGDQLK